jgi:hypothetical protein
MRYITLTPSFHNSSAVESVTVNHLVPGSNPGCGVERIGNVRFFQIENAGQTSEVKSLESPNPFGAFLKTGRIRFGVFSYHRHLTR